jgi:hypothetical protein
MRLIPTNNYVFFTQLFVGIFDITSDDVEVGG